MELSQSLLLGPRQARQVVCPMLSQRPNSIFISREELYEKVWEMPLKRVAEHYDSEFWRLRSACKHYQIPLPPKGYWNKVEAGKSLPKRPPLPLLANSQVRVQLYSGQAENLRRLAEREDRRRDYLTVLSGLTVQPDSRDHPAIADLRRRRKDGYGIANPQIRKLHSAPLSETGERAFNIANVIAKALSAKGFQVSAVSNGYFEASHEQGQERIRVREKFRQVRKKVKKSSPPTYWDRQRGDYEIELEPSGLVECEVGVTLWVDKPREPIEAQLAQIVAEILCRRDDAFESAVQQAEERSRQEELERQVARQERAEQHEKDTWERLVAVANDLREARRVRELLLVLDRMPIDEGVTPGGLTKDEWLTLFRELLAKNDPFANGLEDVLSTFPSFEVDQDD